MPDACAADDDEALAAFATRLATLAGCVDQHLDEHREKELTQDLDDAVALYGAAAADEASRVAVVKLVGRVLSASKNDVVERRALLALGETADAYGARYVKPYLRQPDDEQVPTHLRTAIDVAGQIREDRLVAPLLRLFERSKVSAVSVAAMRSLGKFGDSKRQRTKILEHIVKETLKSKPGGQPRMAGAGGGGIDDGSGYGDTGTTTGRDGGPTARWSALTSALPAALNELTGRSLHKAEDWFVFVKDNKRRLGRLFVDGDE